MSLSRQIREHSSTDRFRRYEQAVRFFRSLTPGVSRRAAFRLVNLAVAYWEWPEWFA